MDTRATEAPCAETGLPCRWASNDVYDEHGELVSWDLFCLDCYRNRDWDLEECSQVTQEGVE